MTLSISTLSVLLLSLASCVLLQEFDYRLWPSHSRSKPLHRSTYELVPLTSPLDRDDTIFFVEQLRYVGEDEDLSEDPSSVDADSPDWEVLNSLNCTPRVPFITTFEKWTGYNWTKYHPEYIRISVYSKSLDRIVHPYGPRVTTVYWDFRYRKLRYRFEFEEGDLPGAVDVVPIPNTPLDVELEKQTRIWWFRPISFTDVAAGTTSTLAINDIESNQAMETNRFRVVFREPRVLYFELRSWNGFGISRTSARGLYTDLQPRSPDDSTFVGLALICCREDGSCPSVVNGFAGVSHVLTSCPIPGDRQLSLRTEHVSIIEEHAIYQRVFRSLYSLPRPNFIDIELPQGLSFAEWYPYYRLEDGGPPENGGSVMKRLVYPTGDEGRYLPIAVDFASEAVVGAELEVHLRIEGGAWQILVVVPKRIPPDYVLPKRLVTAFTWSNPIYFKSQEAYFSLGYNQISRNGYSQSLEYYDEFTPQVRAEEWPEGITFGPEHSLFYSTNPSRELYSLWTALSDSSTDDSKFPSGLSASEINAERVKWQNAIDFFVAAGSGHRRNDFAYNGIIYQQQLKIFGEYLNHVRPEYVNFDIEDWISKTSYLTYIHLSQNAQDRRLPGESDEELYDRICIEVLQDIRRAFDENSPDSKIIWFGTQSIGNWGYSLGSWEVFNRELGGLIPQPEMYKNHKSPEVVQHIMRGNRLMLDDGAHLIPMPTNGCWGEYSPHLALDWCIQFFANGATGFQVYSMNYINTADDLLYMRECVDLVVPYEDIIMDGHVAFHDLERVSKTAVVGLIEHEGEFFVGVSPNYQGHFESWEGSFSLRVPDANWVWVYDARTKRYLRNEISLSNGVLTVEFPDGVPTTVLHISTQNDRFTSSVVVGVILGIGAGVVLIVAIAVVLLFVCVIGRSSREVSEPQKGKGAGEQESTS